MSPEKIRLWLGPLELAIEEDGVRVTVWRDTGKGTVLTPEQFTRRLVAGTRLIIEQSRDLAEALVDGLQNTPMELAELQVTRVEQAIAKCVTFAHCGHGRTTKIAADLLKVLKEIVEEDNALWAPDTLRRFARTERHDDFDDDEDF